MRSATPGPLGLFTPSHDIMLNAYPLHEMLTKIVEANILELGNKLSDIVLAYIVTITMLEMTMVQGKEQTHYE